MRELILISVVRNAIKLEELFDFYLLLRTCPVLNPLLFPVRPPWSKMSLSVFSCSLSSSLSFLLWRYGLRGKIHS